MSDPQYLTLNSELPFLGVSISMTDEGIHLHQHHARLLDLSEQEGYQR